MLYTNIPFCILTGHSLKCSAHWQKTNFLLDSSCLAEEICFGGVCFSSFFSGLNLSETIRLIKGPVISQQFRQCG